MTENTAAFEAKIYGKHDQSRLSMHDMLAFFATSGRLRVSDLHLKIGNPPMYRVDGSLKAINGPPLDPATVEALTRSLLTPKEVDQLVNQHSVDASYKIPEMQFRINCFQENDGWAVAIRALEPKPMNVELLGFPNNAWRDIVQRGFGLVLVTGITGSGKSTTVASLVDYIAKHEAYRIITLEDPIEYRLKSDTSLISQREVGRHVASFESGLRDCLREDPDVIYVGEMRDRESARWTLTAAETGHLVFSTLHTRDALGTVTRLLDMFPTNQQDEIANQLSLGLAYIICQKLLPRADGNGRVVAMEIMNNNYATAHLIRTQKVEQIYSMLQSKTRDLPTERMVSMEQSLARLVADGVVKAQEAERWANHPLEFASALRHMQTVKTEDRNMSLAR